MNNIIYQINHDISKKLVKKTTDIEDWFTKESIKSRKELQQLAYEKEWK